MPVRTRVVALLALAAALLQPAAGAPPADFEQASRHFGQASASHDSAAIEAAAAEFKALSDAAPADPVLRAYLGAATAMRASTTLLPWRKMSHAEDGLAQIDKALAQLTPQHDAPGRRQVPASLETRFVAASTFLALPAMFHRGARGAQLLAQVRSSPLLAGTPQAFRDQVAALAARHPAGAR